MSVRTAGLAPFMIEQDGARYDLRTLSREELLALKLLLEDAARDIRTQLEEAQRRWHFEGIAADRAWFDAAKVALRRKASALQRLNLTLGQHSRAAKAQRQADRPLSGFVYDVAEEWLEPDVLARLVAEAKKRQAAARQETL